MNNMRRIKMFFLGFVIAVLVVAPGCVAPADQNLSVTETSEYSEQLSLDLSLINDVFSSDDSLMATLVLKNETQNVLIVNKRMAPNGLLLIQDDAPLGEVAFIIKDPDGKVLNFNARMHLVFPHDEDFVKLGPDKSIAYSYDLFTYYETYKTFGEYTIQALYHNEAVVDGKSPVWVGKIFSNSVNFKVEK
jgi:hypothetical protein